MSALRIAKALQEAHIPDMPMVNMIPHVDTTTAKAMLNEYRRFETFRKEYKVMPVNYKDHVQSRLTDTSERLTEASQHIAVTSDRIKALQSTHEKTLESIDREMMQRKERTATAHNTEMETLNTTLKEYQDLYIKLSEELAKYTRDLSASAGFSSTQRKNTE